MLILEIYEEQVKDLKIRRMLGFILNETYSWMKI